MTSFKPGRLPAVFPVGLSELPAYATAPLPAAPASVAVPAVTDWGVLANDRLGDCGVAGLEHGLEAAAADTGQHESFPTDQQCADYYLTYTGGQDSGVVLSDFLAYVRAHGYYGHTISAYAPVAVSDIPTLQFATWAYDFCYTGINVTQAMMDAFEAGQPWTAQTAQGATLGGHCIPVVGYDGTYLYAVTWGKVQAIAYPAWQAIAEEAWAVLAGEEVSAGTDGHGLNLAALQADLSQLAKPIPAPAPPAPAPPAPAPADTLTQLAALVRKSAASQQADWKQVLSFLTSHGL